MRYTRLPYGIASAPAIFQSTMEKILAGLEGVICFLDDLLIMGKSKEPHNANLEAVLSKLQDYGIRLKMKKCDFMEKEVDYLGHRIDAEGIHPSSSKITASTSTAKLRHATSTKQRKANNRK